MMLQFNDFIQTYDNNLDQDICNYLIELIDQTGLNEYNLTQNREMSEELTHIHGEVVKLALQVKSEYYEYVCSEAFPETNAFEQIHIFKKTIEDEVPVVDVVDYDTARRFLCLTWFLNDNAGGQHQFVDQLIQPEAGKLLIYPPQWLFPYKENCTVDIPKYTLRTYLHYK